MRRIFEEMLFQMLSDQVLKQVYQLIEWLNMSPWEVWLA